MPELLKNILWMAEELDFQVDSGSKEEARTLIKQFLDLTVNQELSHCLYRA